MSAREARACLTTNRRGPEGLGDVGELAERDLAPVVAVDEQRPDRVEAVAAIVAQADDEVETALAEPDLRLLFTDQPDSHRANRVPRNETDARRRFTIDGNLQLRQPGELLGAEIGDAVDAAHQLFRLFGEPGQLVEIRSEDPGRQVRRRAAQALSMPGSWPDTCATRSATNCRDR
jgi:hypothetical protein